MIEAIGLVKNYGGLCALDHFDLTVKTGEIFALLGPNGAGKTTTIKILCGLLSSDQGQVRIAGVEMAEEPQKAKTQIGLIPDEPYVYPKLTGWEFLELMAGMYRLNGRWAEKAVEYLKIFEMDAAARSRTLLESYSHGMKQKIVFTAVLMRRPPVMLLDEPLVGLDPKSIRHVKAIVQSCAQEGASVLLSTHILTLAEELANRIGILMNGRVQFMGTKLELHQFLKDRHVEAHSGESLEDLFLKATLKEEQ
ncbi:MAG: ABC transporter ATP-binding protein [Elusimicrobia bacterium]|nr:ABC transporter ATP-binding protein [Elusimicrobiota bacterium]